VRKWLLLGSVCALTACGGEDSDGEGMAEEVGGRCVFTPGSYVISYEIVEISDSCGDLDPAPTEYLTVLNDGTILGAGADAPDGCVDTEPVRSGCHSTFNRACELLISGHRVTSTSAYEYDYADGTGNSTLQLRIYSGPASDDLIAVCNETELATMRQRD
jgi:hypothetical protein